MSILIELKKYAKSEEYQKILNIYKNKIENLISIIELAYKKGKIDKTLKYSDKDFLYEKYKIYNEIIDKIKDENTGINVFKNHLKLQAKRCLDTIIFTIKDEKGEIKSHNKYTELDLKTKLIEYYGEILEGELNGLINQYTKDENNNNLSIY